MEVLAKVSTAPPPRERAYLGRSPILAVVHVGTTHALLRPHCWGCCARAMPSCVPVRLDFVALGWVGMGRRWGVGTGAGCGTALN